MIGILPITSGFAATGAHASLEIPLDGPADREDIRPMGQVRIDVVSDLHNGRVYAEDVRKVVARVQESNPDILILAGDLTDDGSSVFRETLRIFQGRWRMAVLAGNHDVWSERRNGGRGYSSQELWETVLPQITREAGATWLETDPLVIEGAKLAIAGTIGWYDYSADKTKRTKKEIAREKERYVADASKIDWPWRDWEFAIARQRSFHTTLSRLSAREGIERILAVTHVPPFMELQSPEMRDGDYYPLTSAYYFAPSLGALLLQFPKVTHVVAGHTHTGRQALIERPGLNPLDARVVDNSEENEIVHYTF